jgi:hypothetical protein
MYPTNATKNVQEESDWSTVGTKELRLLQSGQEDLNHSDSDQGILEPMSATTSLCKHLANLSTPSEKNLCASYLGVPKWLCGSDADS